MITAVLMAALAASDAARPVAHPYEREGAAVPQGRIDELVFDRLRRHGIAPARVCSDAVFLRRPFLDLAGTLPTAAEARRFLRDDNPDKRRALIERLLASDAYADYAAMHWCDLLRVKAEFPINLWPNAAQAYHGWIRRAMAANLPYDRFARELLTSSGSNFRVPQVNFYRAVQSREPETIAQAVALAFMGARAEKWPKERRAGMAAFFARIGYKSTVEWKEEIVFFDRDKEPLRPAVFPDGAAADAPPDRDEREVFADWLIAPDNPWFARAGANRVWRRLLGRGIVHEPDDFRPDNPPSNPELLAHLAHELIASRWDLKHLYRIIANSTTYQLAPIPAGGGAAEEWFACYPVRRLEAEVLIDALNQITGTAEKYSSAIPEPFTFVPETLRSIALPDGSISSSFLETFGRPARDTGLDSERSNRPSAAQRLFLLNSSSVQRKLEQGPAIRALLDSGAKPREIVDELYLAVLSRPPTAAERAAVAAYAASGSVNRREAAIDLVWALINSAEFLYRH